MADIQKVQDNVEKLVKQFQEKHEAIETGQKSTDESLVKIAEDFAKQSQLISDMEVRQNEEAKAREDLEIALANSGNESKKGAISGSPEYMWGFAKYLKTREYIDTDLVEEEYKSIVKSYNINVSDEDMIALKAHIVGSNPDGGFLVPVEQQSRIIKRIFESSPMRDIATVITIGSEATSYPLDDGLYNATEVGEVDSRPETDTSRIAEIDIPVHEQYANPAVTQKMLDDAIFNVESYISNKISQKFSLQENGWFVNGTGVKQPTGFQTLPDWATAAQYERYALETRETAASSTFDGDDLIDLQTDLLEGYQNNATWTMHRKIWAEVLKLKDENNQYLLNPAMLFSGALGMQLLGRPVRLFGDMPSSKTVDNAKVIAYGDWREGYVVVDRMGIRILRDPYTNKPFLHFYATKRTGGNVVNYQAIKRLKIKAAA